VSLLAPALLQAVPQRVIVCIFSILCRYMVIFRGRSQCIPRIRGLVLKRSGNTLLFLAFFSRSFLQLFSLSLFISCHSLLLSLFLVYYLSLFLVRSFFVLPQFLYYLVFFILHLLVRFASYVISSILVHSLFLTFCSLYVLSPFLPSFDFLHS
jgi:hypothetical protein